MRALFVLLLASSVAAAAVSRELQEAVADPEASCQIYREGLNNCTSAASECDVCPEFFLDDGYNIKDQNGGSSSCVAKPAGVYCFQIQSWITCCPECKTPLDEYADCVVNTGRVIDENECSSMCSSGGSVMLGAWYTMLVFGVLAVSSLY